MIKFSVSAFLLLSAQVFASTSTKWSCEYKYFDGQRIVLNYNGSDTVSDKFVLYGDQDCGNVVRTVSFEGKGDSLYFTVHDEGAIGGMDCYGVSETIIRLKIDPRARDAAFEGSTTGTLSCRRS